MEKRRWAYLSLGGEGGSGGGTHRQLNYVFHLSKEWPSAAVVRVLCYKVEHPQQ